MGIQYEGEDVTHYTATLGLLPVLPPSFNDGFLPYLVIKTSDCDWWMRTVATFTSRNPLTLIERNLHKHSNVWWVDRSIYTALHCCQFSSVHCDLISRNEECCISNAGGFHVHLYIGPETHEWGHDN